MFVASTGNRIVAVRVACCFAVAALVACGGGGAAVSPEAGAPQTNPPAAPPPPPSPPAAGAVQVTASGASFSPASISINAGGTITWRINDGTHNVTFGALKPAGGDAGDTGAGGTITRTFAAVGTYPYQCTRHSGMTGQVVVGGSGSAAPPTSPPSNAVTVQATPSAFTPERVEIAPGAGVTWEFAPGAGGIVFDDIAPLDGGIPQQVAGARVTRTFAAVGDYDYHSSTNSNVKGRVRVR